MIAIRGISVLDRDAWKAMLDDYDPSIANEADFAWHRFFDESSGHVGLIAEWNGDIVGFAHFMTNTAYRDLFDITWILAKLKGVQQCLKVILL
jgi:hypothetical protein